jgi:hypothetical protein
MSRYFSSLQKKLAAKRSGQAAVELALGVIPLLILVCGAIDFGRALSDVQVMAALTRQGSNLASRGNGTPSCDTLCTAVSDILVSSSTLNLASNGKIFITALTQVKPVAGGPYTVAEQKASSGGISAKSKIAPNGTGNINIAGAPPLQTGQSLYVTEIFYSFQSATGIGALTNNAVGFPSVLYDIAYF